MQMSIVIGEALVALRLPGCALCRLHEEKEALYLRRLLAERVNDGSTLGQFADSYGWCPEHAWLLEASDYLNWGNGQKAAILYEAVHHRLLRSLSAYRGERASELQEEACAGARPTRWQRLRDSAFGLRRPRAANATPPEWASDRLISRLHGTRCTFCQAMADLDDLVLSVLSEEIDSPRLVQAWREADAACLPHLSALLGRIPDQVTRQWLVEDARAKADQLLAHLEGYMHRYGCHERECYSDGEWAALDRTIAFSAGEPATGRATDALQSARDQARDMYFRQARPAGAKSPERLPGLNRDGCGDPA